jgi:Mg/Co/Ni transporter MgtE
VYDYVGGKADWIAAGLPTVRAPGADRRAIDAMDTDPPIASVGQRARDAGRSDGRPVIVLNDAGVVLGRVSPERLAEDPEAAVEDVMSPGPSTVRAHEPLSELLERMRSRDVADVLVTTPEGRLLGVVRADG